MPFTMPRPARKIGIMPNFLPAMRLPVILVNGVCTSTSSNGKLRVIS